MSVAAERIAANLIAQHERGQRYAPFSQEAGIADLNDAYAVQAAFVAAKRTRRRAAPAGWKIGLTSARMQAMCGIDQPIAGVVLGDEIHGSGAVLQLKGYGRLGIEFEIAVRLRRDLVPSDGPFDPKTVADAVEAVAPAFELIDDRDADYGNIDILSIVADNSWAAGIVLGGWRTAWPDLAAIEGIGFRNNEPIDRGHGRDALGHPFVPLAWLANRLTTAGQRLRAGDVVMTGSLIPTRFPQAGETWRFELAGLGAVELSTTA